MLVMNYVLSSYNNITTIEMYTGVKASIPCFPRKLEKQEHIEEIRNPYDRLWINNFWDVFGDTFLIWLLPIKHEMDGMGLYYPQVPNFEMNDLNSIAENKQVEQTFEINETRESVFHYAKAALFKYKGHHMLIEEKSYVIPENHSKIPSLDNDYNIEDSD